MFYTEIGKIIEAGLDRVKNKVTIMLNYLQKNWKRMEKTEEVNELQPYWNEKTLVRQ